jgi:RHS repeat-associated protein
MSQYRESVVVKMNYVYNGRGEQVRRHLGSSDTYSVYDEAGRWVGDYSSSGTPVQQAIWFDDLPVAVLDGESTAQKLYYVEADMLGTPRVVVDPMRGATGTAVWTWDLADEAFSNTAPNQDPDGDALSFVFNMRFPGQRFDAVSNLNYNYYRDFEPETGRYLEGDPIGLGGGASLYSYVEGAPLDYTDPLGLVRWTGTVTIGYGTSTFKPKSPKRGVQSPGLKLSYATVTVELESDCENGSTTKAGYRGEIALNFSGPKLQRVNGARFNVELYSHQPNYRPDYKQLTGHFSIEASGYLDVSGIVKIGIASGKITGGFSGLDDLVGTGDVILLPNTGFTWGTGHCRCD